MFSFRATTETPSPSFQEFLSLCANSGMSGTEAVKSALKQKPVKGINPDRLPPHRNVFELIKGLLDDGEWSLTMDIVIE
jgi:hypothetical protein